MTSLALGTGPHRVLAAGYEDGSIRLWDIESYDCHVTLRWVMQWMDYVVFLTIDNPCISVVTNQQSLVLCLTAHPHALPQEAR